MKDLGASDRPVHFSQKLTTFITELNLKDSELEKKLISEIVKYFLKISPDRKKQAYALKSMFGKLGLRAELDQFQNGYLNISYYCLRVLYPTFIECLHTKKIVTGFLSTDIGFCFSHLTTEDIACLKSTTLEYDNTNYPNFETYIENGWVRNYKNLTKYVRSKLNKFSIILKNDPSLDFEDCIQEILLSIIRIYNNDPKAFSNRAYVDTAINNHINTLLTYYTRGKRKRTLGSNDKTYREIKLMKQKLHRCEEDDRTKYCAKIEALQDSTKNSEYSSTILDFNEIKCGYELLVSADSIEDEVFVSEILQRVGSKKVIKEYFQILLDHNPEFEKWADQNNMKTSTFTFLCKSAKKYLQTKYKQTPDNWEDYISTTLNFNVKLAML